jgi:hypothetical protein
MATSKRSRVRNWMFSPVSTSIMGHGVVRTATCCPVSPELIPVLEPNPHFVSLMSIPVVGYPGRPFAAYVLRSLN